MMVISKNDMVFGINAKVGTEIILLHQILRSNEPNRPNRPTCPTGSLKTDKLAPAFKEGDFLIDSQP